MVKGNRHQGAVDVGKHLVLVVGELGEAREELVDTIVEGVVDVRTVQVHEDARLISVVIGVAGDVGAALHDRNVRAGGLGHAPRDSGACITGADDDGVVLVGRERTARVHRDAHRDPLNRTTGLAA